MRDVNDNHAQLCPSPEWAEYIQHEVLPSITALTDLGPDMLELGPGPGAATDWLRHRVTRLVGLEADKDAAALLAERFIGANVEAVVGDATAIEYPADSFDSVGSFTMLHHVPTPQLQQQLFAEAFRVLRPGGAFVGSDSLASNDLHHFHVCDTYNPLDPAVLLVRLQSVGFERITITVDGIVKFVAHKRGHDAPAGCEEKSTR